MAEAHRETPKRRLDLTERLNRTIQELAVDYGVTSNATDEWSKDFISHFSREVYIPLKMFIRNHPEDIPTEHIRSRFYGGHERCLYLLLTGTNLRPGEEIPEMTVEPVIGIEDLNKIMRREQGEERRRRVADLGRVALREYSRFRNLEGHY